MNKLLLLLIFALSACAVTDTDPSLPVEVAAPAGAQAAWAAMEHCSGLTRDIHEIQWFRAPSSSTDDFEGGPDLRLSGLYEEPGFITLSYGAYDYAPALQHFALHAIIRSTKHIPLYFEQLCPGV